MNKKYELLPVGSNGLHRIKALRAFAGVEAGELGGYVGGEANLSHGGNAWVYGNAKVFGNAWVYGNAQVYGNAKVYGDAEVLGNAEVYGDARVYGKALVYGNALVCADCTKTPVTLVGLYYNLTVTDNHLKAGCQLHTISDWFTKTDRELLEMDGRKAVKFYHETLKPLMLALNLK